MSRSSDASRLAAASATDRLGLGEDTGAAEVVAAGLDSFALDELDRTAEQRFQGLPEIGEDGEIVADGWLERDEEVGVATRRVEIVSARGDPNTSSRVAPWRRHRVVSSGRRSAIAACMRGSWQDA